ncbi:MAG: hypothetical protein ACI8ZN_002077 [Bacteroidia bacterium]|jgi:hypothetical protein
MNKRVLTFLLFLTFCQIHVFAFQIKGVVTDDHGPLSHVGVYVKGTTYGVITNAKGQYYIELELGNQVLVYEMVGYEKVIRELEVTKDVTVNIVLKESSVELNAVVIDADREDPAYRIIRAAMERRNTTQNKMNSFECEMYLKASLEYERQSAIDSNNSGLTREKINFIESYSKVYFVANNQFKEVKTGYRDLSKKSNQTTSVRIEAGSSPGTQSYEVINPDLYFTQIRDGHWDFYNNLLDLPLLSDIRYTSPIANSALSVYRFRLLESFWEGGSFIYKIEINPKFEGSSLFSGVIYINDKSFTINAVDLKLNAGSLSYFKEFSVIQNYAYSSDSIPMIQRQEFYYGNSTGKKKNFGHTIVQYSNYKTNVEIDAKFMRRGTLIYQDDSYLKNSDYWKQVRPITLKAEENKFIRVQDSIRTELESPEYLQEQDSIYNHLRFMSFIIYGIQHRNRTKGIDWQITPLIAQISINTVDGYRHKLGGSVTKEFKESAKELEVSGHVSYGLLNENIRGKVNLRYLYNPKKFKRLRLEYSTVYTMLNVNNSIQGTFSPSNYVENKGYGIGYEEEWWNGFWSSIKLDYSQYDPYKGKTLEGFWERFPNFNTPEDFNPFQELVLEVNSIITFRQKYEIRPNKKVILGSDFPVLNINYSKGISTILSSDVNYDKLEVSSNYDFKFSKLGTSRMAFLAGRFFNDADVRLSNLKYFRGSDKYFFSNPLRTLQLIGPISLRTSKTYAQAHFVHHFNGAILGKVRFLNRISLQLSGGTSALYLEELNMQHIEFYAGLERPFKLWKQLFRFGAYYVSAANSQDGLSHGFKFGIDFYNAYSRKWTF